MKILYNIITVAALSIILASNSCRKGGKCEEAPNLALSSIVVSFKDLPSDRYLYAEVNPLYNKDSLRVFDQYGSPILLLYALNQIPNTSSRYWVIDIGPVFNQSTDASSFNFEVCKNFIVKYTYNETDTIRTCFKAKKNECGSIFETLKVYHKSLLLASVLNKTNAQITIIKN